MKKELKKRYRQQKRDLGRKRRWEYKFEWDILGVSVIIVLGVTLGYIWDFNLAGIIIGGLGALITLLPRVSSIDRILTDSERLTALEVGYPQLLSWGRMNPEFEHFEDLAIFLWESNPIISPEDYFEIPSEIFIDDYHGIENWEPTGQPPIIWVKYDNEEKEPVGRIYRINSRVNREIQRLESRGQRRFLHLGMAVLAMGFVLQAIGQL